MKISLFSVALILSMTGNGSIASGGEHSDPVNVNESTQILPAKLDILKHAALAGDGDAALKLSIYYTFSAYNKEQERYWSMVAAEDGNPSGANNYGNILLHDANPAERERALYWKSKAKLESRLR